MTKATIFKVKEITEHNGRKYYRVYGYDNKREYFFGMNSFIGSKENKTFMEALEQIDTLIDVRVISEKTIHVVFSDKEGNKINKKETVKAQ